MHWIECSTAFRAAGFDEAAEIVGVSVSKAYADLEYARAWLHLEMGDAGAQGGR